MRKVKQLVHLSLFMKRLVVSSPLIGEQSTNRSVEATLTDALHR